jgi:hypothetical protein
MINGSRMEEANLVPIAPSFPEVEFIGYDY